MEPKVTQLDEVVITAKSPSKVTATGEVFKLSQKSKAVSYTHLDVYKRQRLTEREHTLWIV